MLMVSSLLTYSRDMTSCLSFYLFAVTIGIVSYCKSAVVTTLFSNFKFLINKAGICLFTCFCPCSQFIKSLPGLFRRKGTVSWPIGVLCCEPLQLSLLLNHIFKV